MDCPCCSTPFDANERLPRVLRCGHTVCERCLRFLPQPTECPLDGQCDCRPLMELPFNLALMDAMGLDLTARLNKLSTRSSISSANIKLVHRFMLDVSQLHVTTQVLGAGGFGEVLAGTYKGQPVAIKLVNLGEALPATRSAVQRDVDLALQLSDCKHTCQYKGAAFRGNMFCLVMKRYSRSLAQVIHQEGPHGLPMHRVLRYAAQILAALHEVHGRRVVLLDLKPHNLLLDDAVDELVLSDFGLSGAVDPLLGGLPLSTIGFGTPYFMAPEQFLNSHTTRRTPLTPAVDMWAWACCVVHMATGQLPHAPLETAKLAAHVGAEKRGPAIPGNLPKPLATLLYACLQPLPERRPLPIQALQSLLEFEAAQRHQLFSSTPAHSQAEGATSQPQPGTTAAATAAPALDPAAGDATTSTGLQEDAVGCPQKSAYHSVGSQAAAEPYPSKDEFDEAAAVSQSDALATALADIAGAAAHGCAQCDALPASHGHLELADLVVALDSSSTEAQQCAAAALGSLAAGGFTNQTSIAAVPGCLTKLVRLLSSSSESVQVAAASALEKLAYAHDDNQLSIGLAPGCLLSLTLMMASSSECTQDQTAYTLATLALNNTAVKAAMRDTPGCISCLLDLLADSSSSVAREYAAHTLSSLAVTSFADTPEEISTLLLLMGNAADLSSREKRQMGQLVCADAGRSAAAQQMLAAMPGRVQQLVGLLRGCSHAAAVQEGAVRTISNLVRACPEGAKAVVGVPGSLDLLLHLLDSSSPSIVAAAAQAIGDLATCPTAALRAAVQRYARRLVRLLSSDNDSKVQQAALWALGSTAGMGAQSRAAVAEAPGCLESLVWVLGAGDGDLQAEALATLAGLAKGSRLYAETIAMMPSCLTRLVELLNGDDEALQEAAVGVLTALAKASASNAQLVGGLPGCMKALCRLCGEDVKSAVPPSSLQRAAAAVIGSLEFGY